MLYKLENGEKKGKIILQTVVLIFTIMVIWSSFSAANLGGKLIVALNSDASVRKPKVNQDQ